MIFFGGKYNKNNINYLNLRIYIVIFFLIFKSFLSFSQEKTAQSKPLKMEKVGLSQKDTIPKKVNILESLDSLKQSNTDTIPSPQRPPSNIITGNIPVAESGLDAPITYAAQDSMVVNIRDNSINLYNHATVDYTEYHIEAEIISLRSKIDEIYASGRTLPSGNKTGKVKFKNKDRSFEASAMRLNYKTKKGVVYDTRTTEGEFTIHGAVTKLVSAEGTSLQDDIAYNKNATITTCNASHPHYGIKTRKLKIIPKKIAIASFSQLTIMDIPTPIILPFGFFPLVEGRSSGIIFPNNYDYDDDLGLGFRGVGYYFPINDYFDLRLTGDIYTRGTYRIHAKTNYRKRYKYNGNIQIDYADNKLEDPKDGHILSNKSYSLKITHNQDPKAHPYRNISGNIHLSTNRYDQTNLVNYQDVQNNKITSNFYFRHSMPGTPFSFSAGLSHNQDTKTRKVSITLPDANLTMKTIQPFKSKKGGKKKWFEDINLSYGANFKNYLSATDTTLFKAETWKNIQTGLKHNARLSNNFKLLKYFNANISANAEQFIFTKVLDKKLDPALRFDTLSVSKDQNGNLTVKLDTIYGKIIEEYTPGLKTLEKYDFHFTLSTKLFGTKRFSKGWLRGLRHVMTPSIGFTLAPDTKEKYSGMVLVSSDPRDAGQYDVYNPYSGGVFSPALNEKQMSLTYSLKNLFEGKYYSKRDSSEKKFKILRSLDFSGNYNFARDSFQFSPLSFGGNTTLFDGITNIRFNGSFDFYKRDNQGNLINQLVWTKDKVPVAFHDLNITISNGFSIKDVISWFSPNKSTNRSTSLRSTNRSGRNSSSASKSKNLASGDFSLGDFVGNFRINHSLQYRIQRQPSGRDTAYVRSHSIQLRGSLQLSDKWSLNISNIQYDLKNKSFVYPQFSLSRDLHCWTMQFSWTPARDVYSFFIGVKSSTLSFIKYNYGQTNANILQGRFPR